MNVFLDTNVIIGYIYSLDPLYDASQKAIIDNNTNYYSYHVKKRNKICLSKKR